MGQDGLRTDTQTLQAEGGNFRGIGKDFSTALSSLMDGLHALGGGPPSSPAATGAASPAPSTGEQFWGGLTTLDSKAGAPPWGDDEIGEKFGVVYEGLRDGMYESMRHLSTRLQDIGEALQSMAKNHDANEDFNVALVREQSESAKANGTAIASFSSPQH